MPKRRKAEREKDLLYISEQYYRGKTQAEIGEVLEVSQRTISNDLKELQRRWLESSMVNYNLAVAEELAKVDYLEREYWEAWQKSQDDVEIETVEQSTTSDKNIEGRGMQTERMKKSIRKAGQIGNYAYLKGVEWCIEKRCKLLGLDAPIKSEISGRDGKPIEINSDVNTITIRQYLERADD